MSERSDSAAEWLAKIAERMQKKRDDGNRPVVEKLTVREFVAKFGYARRTRNAVTEIRQALEKNELHTIPNSFDIEYIDNVIEIGLIENDSRTENEKPEQLIVRIDSLEAAHNTPVRVNPDDPLLKATTIMQFRDYDQLPVMAHDREVEGMISWRSIGEAYAHGRVPEKVRDCMERNPHVVRVTTTLSDAADEIYKHGYILVSGLDRTITGIVTAADIAYQFKQRAYPFLLVGEIEGHLRDIVHRKFRGLYTKVPI